MHGLTSGFHRLRLQDQAPPARWEPIRPSGPKRAVGGGGPKAFRWLPQHLVFPDSDHLRMDLPFEFHLQFAFGFP